MSTRDNDDISDMRPWTEKYRPRILSEMIGNRAAISELKRWLDAWLRKLKSAKGSVLLVGPAGIGKTTAAWALANEKGWDVTEVNASDKRNKKEVQRILGAASQTRTLKGKRKLGMILVEEIDGMSGTDDRGGGAALAALIKKAKVPFVCTANDPDSSRLSHIKRVSKVIKFVHPSEAEVFTRLRWIADKEGADLSDELLQSIAKSSCGDIRGAVNDLQAAAYAARMTTDEGTVGHVPTTFWTRDRKIGLEEVLVGVFKSTDYKSAMQATAGAPPDYRMLLALFNEHAYKHAPNPDTLAGVYEQIALADLYKSRIMKRQNWKLLRHFYTHLTAGVALTPGLKWRQTSYGFPSYYGKIAETRRSQAKLIALAARTKEKLHTSQKGFMQMFAPTIQATLNGRDIRIAAETASFLDMSEDEVTSLASRSPDLPRLLKLIEQLRVESIGEALKKKPTGNPFKYWAESIKELQELPPPLEPPTKKRKSKSTKATARTAAVEVMEAPGKPDGDEETKSEDTAAAVVAGATKTKPKKKKRQKGSLDQFFGD